MDKGTDIICTTSRMAQSTGPVYTIQCQALQGRLLNSQGKNIGRPDRRSEAISRWSGPRTWAVGSRGARKLRVTAAAKHRHTSAAKAAEGELETVDRAMEKPCNSDTI